METRKEDKIEQIEGFIQNLQEATPNTIEKYLQDLKTRAACERFFEKIVEAVVDLTFLIIKERKLDIPKEDTEAFYILANEDIISNELAKKFDEAKGMRNFLVHEYGKVDDEKVFYAISNEIVPDVEEFLKNIKNLR